MVGLKVKITRFISSDQPGFVECQFTDAWNKHYTIVEKIPVLTVEDLDGNSNYPLDGIVACNITGELEDTDGRKLVSIDTKMPWAIETIQGLTKFDILAEDVIEF